MVAVNSSRWQVWLRDAFIYLVTLDQFITKQKFTISKRTENGDSSGEEDVATGICEDAELLWLSLLLSVRC